MTNKRQARSSYCTMMWKETPFDLRLRLHHAAFFFLRASWAAASESNDGQDNSNNDADGEQNGDGNAFTNFMDRMDADIDAMWLTAPYEWTTEYWEVLTGAAILLFLAVFLLCCGPICFCSDTHSKIDIKTTDELNDKQKRLLHAEPGDIETAKRQSGATMNDGKTAVAAQKQEEGDGLMVGDTDKSIRNSPNVPLGSTQTTAAQHDDMDAKTTSVRDLKRSSLTSPRRSSKRKGNPTIWSEVVSVWGEFFQHGLNAPIIVEEEEEIEGTLSSGSQYTQLQDDKSAAVQQQRQKHNSATSMEVTHKRTKSTTSPRRKKKSPSKTSDERRTAEDDNRTMFV